MNAENQNQSVEIAIKRIKLLGFNINEIVGIEEAKASNVNLEHRMDLMKEQNLVSIFLKITFTSMNSKQIFMEGTVQNVFEIKPFETVVSSIENQNITLPDQLLVTLLSLSISHTRALVAQAAQGTMYQDFYFPIVNPTQIATDLFKNAALAKNPTLNDGE